MKPVFDEQVGLAAVAIVSFIASLGASGFELWRNKMLKMQAEDIEREHSRLESALDELVAIKSELKQCRHEYQEIKHSLASVQKELHQKIMEIAKHNAIVPDMPQQ